jgi:hypothetical protein
MATVTLLAVTRPDGFGKLLWVAAVPEDQAIEAVLKHVAPGSKVEIAASKLNRHQLATLNLNPGQVIEFRAGMALGRK